MFPNRTSTGVVPAAKQNFDNPTRTSLLFCESHKKIDCPTKENGSFDLISVRTLCGPIRSLKKSNFASCFVTCEETAGLFERIASKAFFCASVREKPSLM